MSVADLVLVLLPTTPSAELLEALEERGWTWRVQSLTTAADWSAAVAAGVTSGATRVLCAGSASSDDGTYDGLAALAAGPSASVVVGLRSGLSWWRRLQRSCLGWTLRLLSDQRPRDAVSPWCALPVASLAGLAPAVSAADWYCAVDWHGVDIMDRPLPLGCGGVVTPAARCWGLLRLTALRMLPLPGGPLERSGAGAYAVSVGIGAGLGVTPSYGFQTIVAGTLALRFRLNLPALLLGTSVTLGPLMFLWIIVQVLLGRWLLQGAVPAETWARWRQDGFPTEVATLGGDLLAWIVGALATVPVAAVIFGGLAWLVARLALWWARRR
jgi:uncharacterized protein (DUF2062 family)